ncbi:MAG: rhomboid family intramembrane serine protease [Tannerella sp.]|jgi:membrane associated rhomboid family serine protease|nr:rhomboid family intramembrane serine protease [Tannerella sp.]
MDREQREALHAAILALLPVAAVWMVFAVDSFFALRLPRYGLVPHDMHRLYGICTLPFLHDGIDHLISNTPALFLLVFGLFLFYEQKAWTILLSHYLIGGFITWCMGHRDSLHVGASGLVYALAAFHFASGLIRRVPRQLAFSLLVAFLYGGFVWAFFPTLYKYTYISWEGHLSGLLTGIALAFYYRRNGPPMPADPFLDEDDDEDEGTDEWRNSTG